MGMSSHQSARAVTVDWLSPPAWLEKLGPFDLDPCCPPVMPWPTATTMYSHHGLEREWSGRVWLNPPFDSHVAPAWLAKLAAHGNGIALIPARTETKMFYAHVWPKADAICFVRGRPHFHYPDGRRAKANSGAPICLIAYGADNVRALYGADLGIVVDLDDRR